MVNSRTSKASPQVPQKTRATEKSASPEGSAAYAKLNAFREKQPKGKHQQEYVARIQKKLISFGIGPAGTGKTWLAVMHALLALQKGDVKKIILTRPVVEAGESLGFLPGPYEEKISPYLRPLYDAFHEFIEKPATDYFIEAGIIEVLPLAYMRGVTMKDSFVILDEAQNTTSMQMKMFLTRFGDGSRIVVNGDLSQVDLPPGVTSGLKAARDKLNQGKSGKIAFTSFTKDDVMRHEMVKEVLRLWDGEE